MASTADATNIDTVDIPGNLQSIWDRIQTACEQAGCDINQVQLVAVSKTKPVELIQVAYDQAGQRIFGEKYVQELVSKIEHFNSLKDIEWHFIGGLQSNKCNALVKACVENDIPIDKLCVETVASQKLASKLNNAVESNTNDNTDEKKKLHVFVQVNTLGEESKSGVSPGDKSTKLCRYILNECPCLQLIGLMMIGAIGNLTAFDILNECRDKVDVDLELSMGMSGDFETAIAKGTMNVRVGSTIFGERDYSNK